MHNIEELIGAFCIKEKKTAFGHTAKSSLKIMDMQIRTL
jgi:hypothetical protein